MMNVLDALMRRLQAVQDMGGNPEMQEGSSAQMPSGLPLVVQNSIRAQPSYGEGEIMGPDPTQTMAALGERTLPFEAPERREYRLNDMLGFDRYYRGQGQFPVTEGGIATPLRPGQSPFASPLNQLLQLGRRAPLSMY